MDNAALTSAFLAHKGQQKKFTRRMAINIADHFDCTPRQIVLRLIDLGLMKRGSWDWFVRNGGFTKEHYAETRADRVAGKPTEPKR